MVSPLNWTAGFAFAILSMLGAAVSAAPGESTKPPPAIVYEGSSTPPLLLKNKGGFLPLAAGGPLTDESFSLNTYAQLGRTVYASTTRSISIALARAVRDDFGWFYAISPTPNMIDLENSAVELFNNQQEFLAMGGVRFEQIRGWAKVTSEDMSKAGISYTELLRGSFTGFTSKPPALNFVDNPDYDKKYDELTPSPGQPQLAKATDGETLESQAQDFMDKHGQSVGWNRESLGEVAKSSSSLNIKIDETELCSNSELWFSIDEADCHRKYPQCRHELDEQNYSLEQFFACLANPSPAA